MRSRILNEIRKIRGEDDLDIVTSNSDRYRIVVRDSDSVSVYGFSMPVYRSDDRKLVDFQFSQIGDEFFVRGSNAVITVDRSGVTLKNKNTFSVLFEDEQVFSLCGDVLCSEKMNISATSNGVMISVHAEAGETVVIHVKTDINNPKILKNSKYFAYLENRFKPFTSISAMYQKHKSRFYPVKLNSEKNDGGSYNILLTGDPTIDGDICFEINAYENKLFQDTTVESNNPKENNAFGSIAFLGNTDLFGEQRLYTGRYFIGI